MGVQIDATYLSDDEDSHDFSDEERDQYNSENSDYQEVDKKSSNTVLRKT